MQPSFHSDSDAPEEYSHHRRNTPITRGILPSTEEYSHHRRNTPITRGILLSTTTTHTVWMEKITLCLLLMLCLGACSSSSDVLKRRKRTWIIDSFSIEEDHEAVYPYELGKIEIEKNFTFFEIHGEGVDKDPMGILQINSDTGMISVYGPVDCEQYRFLKLTFQARDRQNNKVDTQLGIELKIKDANDNAPLFQPDKYVVSIKELTPQGTPLVTVKAHDNDFEPKNSLFTLRIVTVTPKSQNLEFYLTQVGQIGSIYFKGCLDHEQAEKYTIIVEAKDSGEKIQLSSSCTIIINIEDGNNHPPMLTQKAGEWRVKEGLENVLLTRLQVTDQDSKGTPAWRAEYQIQGDPDNNFNITTDPETNDGLLFVKKSLDFEDNPRKSLTIIVENEIPFHSCKVVSRPASGLWQVVTSGVATGTLGRSTSLATVFVEDVNEPPVFKVLNERVTVTENVEKGHYLVTFAATDPDVTAGNTITYQEGEDIAGWITVDSKAGRITTSHVFDRESSFVKNNFYNATILAIDDGQPPMTGTATLFIHITDENDNAPSLAASTLDMCLTDGLPLANITALDPDLDPYSGPFSFKLLGDEKGMWKLDPTQGYTVNLVQEHMVHSGHYELLLEVSDLQGAKATHNMSVTVCKCVDVARPNCRIRKATGAALGGAAIGLLFLSMLLLAALVLLAFFVSCKNHVIAIPDGNTAQQLMKCNIEEPGTDCKVAFDSHDIGFGQIPKTFHVPALKQTINNSTAATKAQSEYGMAQTEILKRNKDYMRQLTTDSVTEDYFRRRNSAYWSMGAFSTTGTKTRLGGSMRVVGSQKDLLLGSQAWTARHAQSFAECMTQRAMLHKVLNKRLYTLETAVEELGDYAPHVYAEEGDQNTNFQLDAISISDRSFNPNSDLDLDFRFSTLASICTPNEKHRRQLKTSTSKTS